MKRNVLGSAVASFVLALVLLSPTTVRAQVKTCGPGFTLGCGADACANLAPGSPCGAGNTCVVLGQCALNTKFYCGCLTNGDIEACIDLAQACTKACKQELGACSRSCQQHDLACKLECAAGRFVCESNCSAEIENAGVNNGCHP